MFSLPDDTQTLLWKVYAAIGVSIAGRTCKISALTHGDIKVLKDSDGVKAICITFDRAKKVTSNTAEVSALLSLIPLSNPPLVYLNIQRGS
jgi:hypothetical protein